MISVIHWIAPSAELPDEDELVLVAWLDGGDIERIEAAHLGCGKFRDDNDAALRPQPQLWARQPGLEDPMPEGTGAGAERRAR